MSFHEAIRSRDRRPLALDLWEAYGLSILTPVVSLARMSKTIFDQTKPRSWELHTVKFTIPRARRKRPLDWSYANTSELWDAGWNAGAKFIERHGDDLPDRSNR